MMDDSSEEDITSQKPVHMIRVDDGPADRTAQPKHLFHKNRQEMDEQIDLLMSEIRRHNEEQRAWLEQQFNEIKQQLQLFLASGIANTLSPMFMQNLSTATSQLHVTSPAVTTSVTSVTSAVTHPIVSTVICPVTAITSTVTTTASAMTAVTSDPISVMPSPVSISTTNGLAETMATADVTGAEVVGAEVSVSDDDLISHSNGKISTTLLHY